MRKSIINKYAATLIQSCIRYRQHMIKNDYVKDKVKAKMIYKIQNSIKVFKNQRLKIRSIEHGVEVKFRYAYF